MRILVMGSVWVGCVLAFLPWLAAATSGTYSVVAPKILRPNIDFHVSVSLHGDVGATNFEVAIEGNQDGGGPVRNAQSRLLEANSTQVVKFPIGELGPGKYNLTVRGSGGLSFFNSTALEYAQKSYSVFIQTDKAIYKPGQLVQFRVIVVNAQLKPSVTGSLDIYVTDGKGNRVKQWNRVFTRQGVFSGELQLSDQPVLGDWNMTVTVLGQTFTKSFQVAEYVLPKFEVTIDLPPYATFSDSNIVATVKAKYTYGKPVRGNATIAVYPVYRVSYIQPFFTEPLRKTVQLNGKADVEFNLAKELKLTDDFEREIRFDVTVIEALTERKQNTSATMTMHKYKYKMELIKTSDSFKPGLKYTAFLKVAYQDNTPVQDAEGSVILRHGFSHNQEEYNSSTYSIPRNGIIELNFYPPSNEDVFTLGVEAQYKDLIEWFSTINRAQSPSNSFLQALLRTEKPTVGQEITIDVNSTHPLDYYVYEVMGRGNVLLAKTVPLQGQRFHSFSFPVQSTMAPLARVLVYYARPDGEIVADALNFDVDGSFQNFAEVTVSRDSVQPGQAVDIRVKTKPNSFVGVLGVDQSVLLLRSGNDISKKDVLEELKSYDSGRRPDYTSWFPEVQPRWLSWWPASSTAGEIFDDSGVIIITNGYVHEHMPFGRLTTVAPRPTAANRPTNQPIPAFGLSTVRVDRGPAVTLRPLTRPPLAGPYAFSRIPQPVDDNPKVYLLRDPPPTWVFATKEAGNDGTALFVKDAPDTITSWVISAFSLDSFHGLGISDQPARMQVFRPFFIQLNLPYNVIRGEAVAIQAVVFNYMNKDVTAEVTLENVGDFEFVGSSWQDNEITDQELFRKKSVFVKSQDGSPVSFLIRPKTIGNIDIKMKATSPSAGDALVRQLLVKAEGETIYHNKAILLDMRSSRSFTENVTITMPKNTVPGSQFVEFSAIADIMGPSINNLDQLLRMPFGCGEQNMLLFVPNIVATEYLKNTGQLTDAVKAKALRFIETGYQRELTYRREDGSFSAFGKSDPSGSTWLTAFVARSFHQALPHIAIEEKVINDALTWLSANQHVNGSFPEVGKVSHTDMQGGSGKGVPLTAYTLLAFLENKNRTKFTNPINKAIDFLAKELPTVTDAYTLSVVTYALHLAEHPSRNQAFDKLDSMANSTEGFKFWFKPNPESLTKNPFASETRSVDVEMTAYALLTYLQRGLVSEALPIMKWMVAQRNSNGGFASTQDTVIGLYALAKLAEKITVPNTNIEVKVMYNEGTKTVNLRRENAMVLQKFKLPRRTTDVVIQASGSGFAILQVSHGYNLNVTGEWPLFTLDPQLFKNADRNRMQLTVCSSFVGEESNMAVMEVTLPSGYVMDVDSLPSLRAYKDVKRVETKEGGTGVTLYFDKMTRQTVCPAILAQRIYKVAEQRKVPVVMYDYYDRSRRARVFYEPIKAEVCDICHGPECKAQCASKEGWTAEEENGKGWGTLDPTSLTAGGQSMTLPTLLTVIISGLLSAFLLL